MMEANKCSFLEYRDRQPFSNNSNLARYIKHMHSSEYVCSYENCMKIFQNREDFIFHEKKEHRVKCELCNNASPVTFKTILQLNAHNRLVHRKKIRHNVHFCIPCDLSLPSKTEYQLHQINNHHSGSGDFILYNTEMSGDHNDYRCEN